MIHTRVLASTLLLLCAPALIAQQAPLTPMTPDMFPGYERVRPQADYVRRVEKIPMRDGVKLYTVIVMKKGTKNGPMLLTRTPYNAAKTTARTPQPAHRRHPAADGCRVRQRWLHPRLPGRARRNGSEGVYVMNRAIRGPLNDTAVDHATDAYDTIDWLVKNVPESNGKVGITGSSYPGFTALVATIDAHPALKASVPQSPMVDGWMGDDCSTMAPSARSASTTSPAKHGFRRQRPGPFRWR